MSRPHVSSLCKVDRYKKSQASDDDDAITASKRSTTTAVCRKDTKLQHLSWQSQQPTSHLVPRDRLKHRDSALCLPMRGGWARLLLAICCTFFWGWGGRYCIPAVDTHVIRLLERVERLMRMRLVVKLHHGYMPIKREMCLICDVMFDLANTVRGRCRSGNDRPRG